MIKVILAALLALAATASHAQLQNENLLAALPPGYKVDFQLKDPKAIISEMVPSAENVHAWTEMVTVQIFFGLKVAPGEFRARLEKLWGDSCPGSTFHTVGSGSENGYPALVWIQNCPLNKQTGKPEITWMKAIRGNDSLYLVQKAFKFMPSDEQVTAWTKYLRGVAVCDSRLPEDELAGWKCRRGRAILSALSPPVHRTAPMSPPALPYVAVPESFKLPPGVNFGGTSGIAFTSKGTMFVIHRGPMPLMEFDADGNFMRGFGDGMFDRPHGLRIDAHDNIWTSDVASNLVYKFNASGRLEMTLGVKGWTGEWHPYGHLKLFHEPNEAVVGPTGRIYVLQGHGKAESCIHMFDASGDFIKTIGKKGKGPGEFDLPHSLVFDKAGLLYVADRNNGRIQVLDEDGTYIRESSHPGTPCGLYMTQDLKSGDQHIWLAHGHTGEVMKLDLQGNVVGKMQGSGQGKTLGKYGEAHYIAVSPRDEIFVADTLNYRVQKYVKG